MQISHPLRVRDRMQHVIYVTYMAELGLINHEEDLEIISHSGLRYHLLPCKVVMGNKTYHLRVIATKKRWYFKKVIHTIDSMWNKSAFWTGERSMVTGYSRSRWVDLFFKNLQGVFFSPLQLNYELNGVITKKANVNFSLPPGLHLVVVLYLVLIFVDFILSVIMSCPL